MPRRHTHTKLKLAEREGATVEVKQRAVDVGDGDAKADRRAFHLGDVIFLSCTASQVDGAAQTWTVGGDEPAFL
jgi:hypothetical protein